MSELQTEINEAIERVQTAVSTVLTGSAAETLGQYHQHIAIITSEHAPHLETFEKLVPGDCKNSAETILTNIIEFTGYDASNCAKIYDQKVREKVANTSQSLVQHDNVFSQLHMIVVKGFVGENAFVSPEVIKDKITQMYELVKTIKENAIFDSDGFVSKLRTEISAQNAELGNCHDEILDLAYGQFAYFERVAKTCDRFDEEPVGKSKRKAVDTEEHEQLLKEFLDQFEKLNYYEWKA